MLIPDALARHRSGFLAALSAAEASKTLQENWRRFGVAVLPSAQLWPPDGLSVSAFQHEKHLCVLITFPMPKAPGESYFGFVVAGPSNDWSPDARARVPVRYFLLEHTASAMPAVLEWRPTSGQEEEVFAGIGLGPSPQNPFDFVDAMLSRFYALKPDGTIGVAADDPEMAAAITAARATLPQYWQVFEHREQGETDFSLKVKTSDTHGTEHFWAVDISRKDGVVYGTIDNEPRLVTSAKPGGRVLVRSEDISDWGFIRNGRIHGKHTLRVLMKRMPPKEAEIYRKMLAEP